MNETTRRELELEICFIKGKNNNYSNWASVFCLKQYFLTILW